MFPGDLTIKMRTGQPFAAFPKQKKTDQRYRPALPKRDGISDSPGREAVMFPSSGREDCSP